VTESFKLLAEIFEPDSRNLGVWTGPPGVAGSRPIDLAHQHDVLARLELHGGVPDYIREHFLTARHLALYAWFVYRFSMPSQLQAYATLEYALRERLGYADGEHPPGLKRLLTEASSRGLLQEERIRDWPGHRREPSVSSEFPSGSWLTIVADALPYFRNDLAHGSFTLSPDGGRTLRVVADIVNQLWLPDV
jgi:hypothetical protein